MYRNQKQVMYEDLEIRKQRNMKAGISNFDTHHH